MSKKILCTLAALAVFLLVTAVFAAGLQDVLPKMNREEGQSLAYTRPEAVSVAETTETQPPETEPLETLPPETEPVVERFSYDAVPLYDQTAYPDSLYRSGTLATSGSNITSLAMVASYLTGHEYLPVDLADYFADYIGNSMQWLEYASDQLQLPWWKAGNIDEVIQYLKEGNVAICDSMDES